MIRLALTAFLLLAAALPTQAAAETDAALVDGAAPGAVALVVEGRPAPILLDGDEDPAVIRAARSLEADLARVAGGGARPAPAPIILGTLGRGGTVDQLVREGRLDVGGVAGEWEA